jgi:hypothetical protein
MFGLVRGHSVAGLLPVNILEPDDIELPLIHYNSKDYKQAIRDIFTGHFHQKRFKNFS